MHKFERDIFSYKIISYTILISNSVLALASEFAREKERCIRKIER